MNVIPLIGVAFWGWSLMVAWFGTPLAALALLIGLKTAADPFFHLREHSRAGSPAAV